MKFIFTSISIPMAKMGLSNFIIIGTVLLFVFIYWLFFKRKHNGFIKFIKYILFPYTLLSGFTLNFICFQFTDHESYANEKILPNLLKSFVSTTHLFLESDIESLGEPFKNNAILQGLFYLTAAIGAFIFVALVVHLFFKDWLNRIKIQNMNAKENHFFFGLNTATFSLSNNLLKNNKSRLVVFVNDFYEKDDHHLYSVLPAHAYVIKRKAFMESITLEKEDGVFEFLSITEHKQYTANNEVFYNLRILKKKILYTETCLYFMTNDENWNITYATLAMSELNRFSEEKIGRIKKVRIHVAVFTDVSYKHFSKYSKLNSEISIIIHHYASIVSRQLINEYHPVDFVAIDPQSAIAKKDFNPVIIGLGQVGTQILRKIIEQGQFVGSSFNATIYDYRMEVLKGRFQHLFPGIIGNYNLEFIDAPVGSDKFYNSIEVVLEKSNYIVLSLGNDDLNIRTALDILEINLQKRNNDFKIFIQLEKKSHWNETLKIFERHLFIFGDSDKVYSEENILQNKIEIQAKKIHEMYNQLYSNSTPFHSISKHEQLSNLSVAEHLYAKIKLLGFENFNEFLAKFSNKDNYVNFLSESQKLNLSIGEHLRWNAFHYVNSWKILPIHEIKGTEKNERYKNRKNPVTKKHACLVDWNQLKRLEDFFGRDMQQPDIDSIENLYTFIISSIEGVKL